MEMTKHGLSNVQLILDLCYVCSYFFHCLPCGNLRALQFFVVTYEKMGNNGEEYKRIFFDIFVFAQLVVEPFYGRRKILRICFLRLQISSRVDTILDSNKFP